MLQALTGGNILIPRLLWHDANRHVLLMTDLGTLPDLSSVFSDLGGSILGDRILASSAIHSYNKGNFFQDFGECLGSFFAALHSPQILKEVRSVLRSDSELTNTSAREVIVDGAITPVRGHLNRFPDLIRPEEADQLLAALIDDFWRSNEASEESLVLGDCWTGAILAPPPPHDGAIDPECPIEVGVIDWEFASIGRGVHGDMAQFLAHLELLSISASQSRDFENHGVAVRSLIQSIISSYRATSTHPTSRPDDEHNPSSQSLRTKVIRSALLSHGAEIINNVFWKRWRCVDASCPRAGDLHTDASRIHECVLIRRMVERGLTYLRAGYQLLSNSGSSASDFDGNPAQRLWLLDLFQTRSEACDALPLERVDSGVVLDAGRNLEPTAVPILL